MARIVSWFSCGAASAVATKLALANADGREVVIAYCDTSKREHPDNMRFMRDCEAWFGQEILILGNDEYERDPDVVFRKTRFLVGPKGARCTAELKRAVRLGFQRPDDTVIIGYTADEQHRMDRLTTAEPMVTFWPVLIQRGLTKDDCLGMLERVGIKLPAMYRLGYRNNNCIGCVKGQAGYWNKIRLDFPERFAEMAAIERELGRAICKREWRDQDGTRHLERIPLDRLPPDLGRYSTEPDISCGIICQSVSAEIEDCDEEAA